MNIPLTIIGFIIMATGAFVNFMPNYFVKKFIREDKIEVNPIYEFTDEEKAKYRHDTAVIKVKKVAFLILLVGIIMILIATKFNNI